MRSPVTGSIALVMLFIALPPGVESSITDSIISAAVAGSASFMRATNASMSSTAAPDIERPEAAPDFEPPALPALAVAFGSTSFGGAISVSTDDSANFFTPSAYALRPATDGSSPMLANISLAAVALSLRAPSAVCAVDLMSPRPAPPMAASMRPCDTSPSTCALCMRSSSTAIVQRSESLSASDAQLPRSASAAA